MTPPLTYLQFHLVFTIPPILALGWLASRRDRARWGREAFSGLAILVVLAVAYTTPWTNAMIPEDVWWYGEGAVLATIWYTPIEEYLFFVLQTTLTAFWLFQFLDVADVSLRLPVSHRLVGVVAGLGICASGWVLLGTTSTFYLGSILFWAGPILAIQWGFGLTYLLRERRQVLIAVGVPTLYLWVADWIAISLGIWIISDVHTIGVGLAGLPLEEALFFLVANLFVVQGIVLYVWVLDRRAELASLPQVRRLAGRVATQSTDD
ncbi:lycopene cyclase domain-containing protein [Natrialbaceae archaeon A-arb3/5]